MRIFRFSLLVMLTASSLGALGFAVEAASGGAIHDIFQKRRSFGVSAISIKQGDSLIFINDDPYAHNVYSREPKGWLDLGIQEEGERMSIVFDSAGNFDIRCRIHPRMRMMVSVD
jgi:plastocyanin